MSLFDIFKKKYNKTPQDNMPRCVYGTPDSMNGAKNSHKIIFCYREIHMVGNNGDKREHTVIVTADGNTVIETVRFGSNTGTSMSFQSNRIIKIINQVLKEREAVIQACDGSVSAGCTTQFNINFGNKSITLDETSYTGEIKETVDMILTEIQSNAKYDIKPEDNRPAKVYGVYNPDRFKDSVKKKYNVNPEENIPYEVYGVFFPDDPEIKDDQE